MVNDLEAKGQFGWGNTNLTKRTAYLGILIRVLDYQFSLPTIQQNLPYILSVSNYITYLLGTYFKQGSITSYPYAVLPTGTSFIVAGSNIAGPAGAAGTSITTISVLPNLTPGSGSGRVNDYQLYLNVGDPTNNGKLYQNIAGTNTLVGNLSGPSGSSGGGIASLIGDVTASGSGAVIATLKPITQGSTGTSFVKVGLDGQGRVINNAPVLATDLSTLLNSTYYPLASNPSGFLTANQTISFSASGGDVTGASSGTTSLAPSLAIGLGKVTYTKLQVSAGANVLLGSTSIGGTYQELTLGSNLSIAGGVLNAT
jgi:hypothetical protein